MTPAFLGGSVGAEATQQADRLGKLSAATDFLGGLVFDYAKSHPRDARVPESLYWLVRAGHYGCADVNTWKTTRSVFRLLHQRYGRTTWAKRTPTWFKNDFDIRQQVQQLQSQQ